MSNLCDIIKHHPKTNTNDADKTTTKELTSRNSDEQKVLIETEEILMSEELNKLKKFAFLGEVSSGLAHEVKNITQVLKGFTQLLEIEVSEKNMSNTKINDYILLLKDHIDLLYKTVGDFNDIAKYEDLQLSLVNSQDLVADAMNIFQYKKENVNFQIFGSPIFFKADKVKIKTILVNLIKNSLESIESVDRQGIVSISFYSNHDDIIFNIKDNGVGIPKEKIDCLFHPFHTTKKNGSGVGLNQSLKLAKLHLGDLFCEYSTPDETSFTLKLSSKLHDLIS